VETIDALVMVLELSIVTGARDEVVKLRPVAENVEMLTLGQDFVPESDAGTVDTCEVCAVPCGSEFAVMVTISVVETTATPLGGSVARLIPISIAGGVPETTTVVVTCIR
jgi:hypothetical protein